jgi:hypothetical protein
MDYRPPSIGQPHKYDEIVIFQEAHILPKFIVHLQRKLQPTPSLSSPTKAPSSWTIDEVINWMKTLELSQDYSKLIKDANIKGAALKTMKTSQDWQELGVQVFGDRRILANAVTELFRS